MTKIITLLCFLAWPVTLVGGSVTARANNAGKVPSVKDWDAAGKQAHSVVSKLTLSEKIGIVSGHPGELGDNTACIGTIKAIDRVGFGGLCLQDGPTAVNRHQLVSIFPAGVATAATWDKHLMFERAVALGQEFRDKGIHVPSTGPIGRHALGGRNWESFSPDPYLSGEAMRQSVIGSQSVGVQTCSKHLIGNEQETERNTMSSNIDDRTLHELYLWPFADAVQAGTTSIMTGHNRLNGTYSSANKKLLTTILREELGFRGYVMSDWWGTHSTEDSANAGLDMEQPGVATPRDDVYWGELLEAAVEKGDVSKERLDTMARSILTPYYLLRQNSRDYPSVDDAEGEGYPTNRDVRRDHAKLIRRMGAAGTVLLKNTKSFLPLPSQRLNIGVFGNDASEPADGLAFSGWSPAPGPEYGTLDIGGGAGAGRHSNLVAPLEAIKKRARDSGSLVQYILNNDLLAANTLSAIHPVPDVCLVFLKTFMAEGWDREEFENDWNSTRVVNNVASLCPGKTVVITHSGGVNTYPWANNPNVTAILAAHYPGEETGNAIVDVLWGDAEPSGRLPYTIPKSATDFNIPIVEEKDGESDFTEGLFIDYRHFDANDVEPLYEFGFGLGYTKFELVGRPPAVEKLKAGKGKVNPTPDHKAKIIPGGHPDLWAEMVRVKTTVKNTGGRKGSAVPQLYLSYPKDSIPDGTPVRVLRGFEKADIGPGQSKGFTFVLARRDLSYWDVAAQAWRIPAGKFELAVGFSSRDLRGKATLKIL
ncbi:glycosyl hydrolase family 3 N terminal domain-containing [Fusarium albosuccineum]|uniref:Beta-glucosidase cel3A n=1 Tax=Fusarium albosuccineum TaxID=1237068 RepID=A0A8H4NVT9_9HYPO|nr:glycosyl hydrolase family 3 N terminal domain-containing [Fusarium albosuccineum]